MSQENVKVAVRRATEADADEVTELFTLAFHEDPTWSWAFPDPEKGWTATEPGGASTCTAPFPTGGYG